MNKRELLTTGEVARYFGRSTRWVWRQIEAGRLGAYIFTPNERRVIRVSNEDVLAFEKQFVNRVLPKNPRE
jgi:excisionase family DNA binding protein